MHDYNIQVVHHPYIWISFSCSFLVLCESTPHPTVGYKWPTPKILIVRAEKPLKLVACFNPSEKYESVWMSIPNIWRNNKCSKAPSRKSFTSKQKSGKNKQQIYRTAFSYNQVNTRNIKTDQGCLHYRALFFP